YLLLKRYCLKTLSLNAKQILSGDVNKDGKADSKDYVLLKRHCLGTYVIK
ncbi:MAG: dockerin type I repeat-containing protein, partial [Clostridiales bacterium]|nr:dockerin type I repeat-containing protein [Candidatus Coliplasma equi]